LLVGYLWDIMGWERGRGEGMWNGFFKDDGFKI